MQRFVSGSREQAFLLPPDMREWLAEDHLVWLVVAAIARCDTRPFAAAYRDDGQGRPAYDPAVLATLLVYAYAVGERSSRAIERRCREDVAFRVAAAGLAPDHVTIARFRRRHAEALIGLFSGVLRLCAAAGLVRVGLVAIDGTKLRADANKDRLEPEAVEQVVSAILEQAEQADADEDRLAGDAERAVRGLAPEQLGGGDGCAAGTGARRSSSTLLHRDARPGRAANAVSDERSDRCRAAHRRRAWPGPRAGRSPARAAKPDRSRQSADARPKRLGTGLQRAGRGRRWTTGSWAAPAGASWATRSVGVAQGVTHCLPTLHSLVERPRLSLENR